MTAAWCPSYVLRQARSLLDKLKAYEVLICLSRAEAAGVAFDVLRYASVSFPRRRQPGRSSARAGGDPGRLAERPIADLIDLPRMTDPGHWPRCISSVSTASIAVYGAAPHLFPAVCYQAGGALDPLWERATVALLLCALWPDPLRGWDIEGKLPVGQLGLAARPAGRRRVPAEGALFTAREVISHWKEHVHDTLPLGRVVYQIGLSLKNLDFANLATVGCAVYAYRSGKELAPLERRRSPPTPRPSPRCNGGLTLPAADLSADDADLLDQSEDPSQLRGAVCDVERSLPDHIARHDGTSAFAVYLNQLSLCYLFDRLAEALQHAELDEQFGQLCVLETPRLD